MKEYFKLNILEIQELFDKKELTSKQLCDYYLKRIEKYNHYTNSIRMINPEALEIASQMDLELNKGNKRSLLHGIPVLIKDNINTNDKMKTTAGSIILKDLYASYDAFIVEKLRKAGAVILGKTNLSEFANFISTESENGFSALGGQVINPYNKKFDVGGSSSGSGSAMATSLAQVAIGTETSGSILSPALRNSIIGVKPTLGWISRTGIVPISPSQDVPGPMTRNVLDSAILLSEMVGFDERDSSTHNENSNKRINIDVVKDKDALKNARLGVVRGYLLGDASKEELDLFEKTLESIKILGGNLIDVEINKPKNELNGNVLLYEFPIALKDFMDKEKNPPFNTLKELINFNLENPKERIPYGQQLFEKCDELDITEKQYKQARQNDIEWSNQIKELIDTNNLDALIFPSYYGCNIGAKGGYPSVIVPCGYLKDNESFSISFTSKKYSEETLLKLAYSFEQSIKARKEPELNNL